MSKIFFIAGPHCAGKTSIIRMLGRDGVVKNAGFEIGKEFYYARKKNGFTTEGATSDFEFEVTNAELQRDNQFLSDTGVSIAESWHPGNLAYVLKRTPSVYNEVLDKIKSSMLFSEKVEVTGFWLQVSYNNIYYRTKTFHDNREWAAQFYTELNDNIGKALTDLQLLDNTVVIDANKPFYSVYKEIKKTLSERA